MSTAIAMDLMKKYLANGIYVDGFEYLGAGVSRYAYRSHADGMVYKLGNHRCNVSEMEAAAYFRGRFPIPGIYWPQFTVHFETISGMQSVSETVYLPRETTGQYHPGYDSFLRILYDNGITDCHPGNVYSYRGLLVCIDYGYWIKDRPCDRTPNPEPPCDCSLCRQAENILEQVQSCF